MPIRGGLWRSWKLSGVSPFVLGRAITVTGCFAIASSGDYVLAEITSDNTLGAESSQVTSPTQRTFLIEQGATRGTNLFHSFSQFSVPTNGSAYFNNAGDIQNIITRITGESVSNIDGLIRANRRANLFLINPNGIIFGPNARLHVGGSFVATTANAVGFGNQGFWSASQPEAPSLLTVNPSAFFFNQIATAPIINRSQAPNRINPTDVDGLRVRDGRSLLLVGGNVTLDGGVLNAPGGRVELGGLAGAGTVGLSINDKNLRLSFPNTVALSDVSLTNQAFVNVSAGGGGNIVINAQNLSMAGESILFTGIDSGGGTVDSIAGNIEINATEAINLTDDSRINNWLIGTGQGGDINITTGQLLISGGAEVTAITTGAGDGGNLIINASDSVQVIGTSATGPFLSNLTATTFGSGTAGNVTITTRQLLISDGGQVGAGTFSSGNGGNLIVNASEKVQVIGTTPNGQGSSGLYTQSEPTATGKAGNLMITTGQLLVLEGGHISASTFGSGDGGNLIVDALDFVQLIGTSAKGKAPSGLFVDTQGTGRAGNLLITTGQLLVTGGALVNASTLGSGNGGSLIVNALDSIQVIGTSASGVPSTLTTSTEGTGKAGNLVITTGQLKVLDGAQIGASTFSSGDGGNFMVNASDSIQLIGISADGQYSSNLNAGTTGTGKGGNLELTTRQLLVSDGAQVDAGTRGLGKGGNLIVNASEQVQLIGTTPDGQFPSGLFTSTDGTGDAGNLVIATRQLIVRDRAQVSVSSDGTGKAGDIEVTAHSMRLDNKGKITAETASGNGGNIRLQPQDLLLMRHGSSISTSAGTAKLGGDGGNIAINAEDGFIVAVPSENSDIRANAFTGKGGNVQITAQGIFGTQFRPQDTLLSDITASSQFGVQGTVQINTPDVDPSRGLTELPVKPVNVEVTQGCQTAGKQTSVAFFNTGRGGLAPNPYEPISSSDIWEDVPPSTQRAENSASAASASASSATPPDQLVEAQGWIVNEKGEVTLVAEMPATRSQSRCRLR